MKMFLLLLSCYFLLACQTPQRPPPIHVEPLFKSASSSNMLAPLNVAEPFPQAPIARSEIDPITDYIKQYEVDPVMRPAVVNAMRQREQLCRQVEQFYQGKLSDKTAIDAVAEQYSYSCPFVVAGFIDQYESQIERVIR